MEVVQSQGILTENAVEVPVICLVIIDWRTKKISNVENQSEQKTPRDFLSQNEKIMFYFN